MLALFSLPGLIGILIIIFGIYRLVIYPAVVSPLSRIPNAHWSAPFSSVWILWTRYTTQENRNVHGAHLERGPIVRLGPNEISVSCIDGGVRSVYGGGFEKGNWYSIFDNYGVPCMFSSLNSRPHSVRKRWISHVYSKSTIHASRPLEAQARMILFSRLFPIIKSTMDPQQVPHGVDVHDLWMAATMDFITAYLFGIAHSSNFLFDVPFRQHFLELYHSRKTYTFFYQELPRLTKFMHSFGIRLVPRWVDYANREIEAWVAKLCSTTISANLAPEHFVSHPEDEPVVLNVLLSGIGKENVKGDESVVSDTALREPDLSISSEMLDQLAAGHETSGITLTYLTWHLSQDVALQDALRAELFTLDPPLKYVPPSASDDKAAWLEKIELPSSKQLDSLPILHAVIMETLRLNAAIPGHQPRMSPSPSTTLRTYEIPGGVRVGAGAYNLHRNVGAYPYPDLWDYTRWLDFKDGEPKAAEAKRDRDRNFWAFSSGGRMCVGSNFAMHELKLIVAAVYTNFTTHIVNDDGIEQMDGYTCGPKSNKLVLRFEEAKEPIVEEKLPEEVLSPEEGLTDGVSEGKVIHFE